MTRREALRVFSFEPCAYPPSDFPVVRRGSRIRGGRAAWVQVEPEAEFFNDFSRAHARARKAGRIPYWT